MTTREVRLERAVKSNFANVKLFDLSILLFCQHSSRLLRFRVMLSFASVVLDSGGGA